MDLKVLLEELLGLEHLVAVHASASNVRPRHDAPRARKGAYTASSDSAPPSYAAIPQFTIQTSAPNEADYRHCEASASWSCQGPRRTEVVVVVERGSMPVDVVDVADVVAEEEVVTVVEVEEDVTW
eukprot:3076470-Rhodomonas_salina.3